MNRPLLFGVALALAAVAACSPFVRRTPVPPREGAAYFPLADGSWWLYRVEDFVLRWKFERRVEVTRRHVLTPIGREAAVLEETYTSEGGPFFRAPVQPMGFFWQDGFLNAVYLSDRDLRPIEGIQPIRILPERVEAEMTWSGGGRILPDHGIGFEVDRRHELHREAGVVRVPAGSFEGAIRVDTTAIHRGSAGSPSQSDVRFHYSDWYVPGVGLVRSETWDDAGRRSLRTRVELVETGAAAPGGTLAARTRSDLLTRGESRASHEDMR